MSDITINIKQYDDPDALMHPDKGSLTDVTENIYLVLDPEDRRVSVITLHAAARDGTPMDVYHNRKIRLRLPDSTNASRLLEWGRSKRDLIQTVFDGYSSEWDGSNVVGKYDDDATVALNRLQALVSDNHKHPSAQLTNPVYGDPIQRDFDEVERRTVDVPTHDIHMVNAGECLAPAEEEIIEEYGLSEDTSEERLEEVARKLEEEARTMGPNTKLYGTLDYLKGLFETTSIR